MTAKPELTRRRVNKPWLGLPRMTLGTHFALGLATAWQRRHHDAEPGIDPRFHLRGRCEVKPHIRHFAAAAGTD